ncbi:hypothetical protein PHMEG_0005385 [Phytophthora megakarya]|uniref:Reverse transcriptase n=1 Tax=Phytophthora megakarya TaxID=4795 RepID=A0A225WRD9_9STRA|nr:hypothetical protein PHMEG_0005385 [Phytophthora megakarya]
MAKEFQATEKAKWAQERNEKPSRKEQAACPQRSNDRSVDGSLNPPSLFQPKNIVLLYMERVKPGVGMDHIARIKRKVEKFAYELELSYKIHVPRLKAVNDFCDRPKPQLAQDITEDTRFDFDEELFPEASWELDTVAGEFDVEAVFNDRTPMSTSTASQWESLKSSGLVMRKRHGNLRQISLVVVSCTITYEIKGANTGSKWPKLLTRTS